VSLLLREAELLLLLLFMKQAESCACCGWQLRACRTRRTLRRAVSRVEPGTAVGEDATVGDEGGFWGVVSLVLTSGAGCESGVQNAKSARVCAATNSLRAVVVPDSPLFGDGGAFGMATAEAEAAPPTPPRRRIIIALRGAAKGAEGV